MNNDNYVAYCRYNDHTVVTCDSTDKGAFKVYKESELTKAFEEGQACQAILELAARDRFIASLK